MLYISSYFVVLFTLQIIGIIHLEFSYWMLGVWVLLCALIFHYRKRWMLPQDHPHYQSRKQMVWAWLVSLVLLIGAHAYFQYYFHAHERSYITAMAAEGETVQVEGVLNSAIDIDGNRIQFQLRVSHINEEKLPNTEKVVLTRYSEYLEERNQYHLLNRGDRWRGMVQLSTPQPARNPGAFDYREYLNHQGIHHIGQIMSDEWAYQAVTGAPQQLLRVLDRQRLAWISQVERIFSDDVVPIVEAMTIGKRDQISPDLLNAYQQLGVVHLLAISGLHVGIILWVLHWVLSRFPITREKIYALLFLFIPIYIYLSGALVSVVRAGLMAMVALICLRFRLWKHSLLIMYGVYVCTLVYNPFYLFHIGYQLSFAVTFLLIAGYRTVSTWMPEWPEPLKQAVSIALLAQLASVPIVLYHFYQFSPVSLFLNLVLVPIYSAIFIPFSFVLPLISFVHIDLIRLPVMMYEYGLKGIHQGLEWMQGYSFASLYVGRPASWWFFLFATVVLVLLIQLEQKRWKLSGLCLGLLPVLIFIQMTLPYWDREAKIMVLDVGQGDAIVIELPFREEVVLIDVGGQFQFTEEEWQKRDQEFEVGRDIVWPYLQYRGIRNVDKVVITHGHYDHFGGIQGLLGNVGIERVLRGPVYPQSEFETTWLQKIAEEGIPIYHLGRGDSWQTRHAYFEVLFPEKNNGLRHVDNLNDPSVVLWNQIYGTRLLWTGDVEEEGENFLMQKYPNLQVDLLKVAHHGSHTSTSLEWVQHVQPEVSLIPVGRNNRYGHPHPDVIDHLSHEESDIFRTDIHGGVMIKITPEGATVLPTLP